MPDHPWDREPTPCRATFRAFCRHYRPMLRRLERDLRELLSFFSFPRHLWKKLGTTNIIEPCFVEVCPGRWSAFVKEPVWTASYSIFQRFNLEWANRTLKLFTQAGDITKPYLCSLAT